MHVATFAPLDVVHVIVTLPAFTPFTAPAVVTVAMAVLLLFHVTVLIAAFDGDTAGTSV